MTKSEPKSTKISLTTKRTITLAVSLIVLVVLIFFLGDVFRTILTEEGRIKFGSVVTDLGWLGYFVIIGLTIVQVFLAIIPGEPVELLAGMCYGATGGLIVIYIGIFISSSMVFFLVRRVGEASIYSFVSEEKVKKIEKSKLFNSKNAEGLLLLMLALPGTPKDLFTFMGALLPSVRAKRFLVLSTLVRFPSIITSTVVGGSFMAGETKFALIVYATTFVVSFLVFIIYSKRRYGKEIIEIAKD